jgi:group I intron endonuclease
MSSKNIYSIYLIENLINHKKYVGYTSNKIGHRFKDHCSIKKPKYQDRSIISLAIEKYGKENFSCDIIFQSKDYEYCRSIETDFIIQYNSLTDTQGGWGYNIDKGGRGHKRSPETIEKHRQKLKGRPQSEEHKKKKGFKSGNTIGSNNKGKKRTEEQRKMYSESMKNAIASGKRLACGTGRNWKNDYPEALEKMKQTKLQNRILTNRYKNVVIKKIGESPIHLDENYMDFLEQHKLNNFMNLCIKYEGRIIKGWQLVSYEKNR